MKQGKRFRQERITNMSKQLFLKYMKLYLGICCIVLAAMVPVYVSMYQTTKKMIVSDMYGKLQKGGAEMDSRIRKMQTVSELIRKNEYVSKVAQLRSEPSSKDYFYFVKASDAINENLLLSMEDECQFMMFRDNPVLISRDEILCNEDYQDYQAYLASAGSFYEKREEVFRNLYRIQFLPTGVYQYQGETEEAIACAVKGPAGIPGNYDTSMVFLQDVEELKGIFGLEEIDQDSRDFVSMTDRQGVLLYGKDLSGQETEINNGKTGRIQLDQGNYTLLKVTTPEYGFSVTLGISDHTIQSRIQGATWLIGLYLLTAIVGMILFCIYFAIQRMQKMKVILKSLRQEELSDEIGDEYQFINRKIGQLWRENEQIKERILDMQEDVSNSMLERLLRRGVYSSTEKEKIQKYLQWDMEFYCVVCVKGNYQEEEEALKNFLYLDFYMEERFETLPVSFGVNERAYIVKMSSADFPDTREVVEKLRGAVENNGFLRAGVSAVGTGLENLNLCYKQAALALRQLFLGGSILEYREQQYNRASLSRLNLHSQLYDLVLAGEEKAVEQVFEKIRRYVVQFPCQTEQEMMRLFFEVEAPLARIGEEIQGMEKVLLPKYDPSKTMHQLLEEQKKAAFSFCREIAERTQKEAVGEKEEVLSFLREHYADKDMCVAYMAEQFGFSEKYFISFFKKQTGMNFSAYLEDFRLKQAEKYLLETDESIYKIAEAVGYNTVDAFYKSFKKVYGMPPGKWKESRKREY